MRKILGGLVALGLLCLTPGAGAAYQLSNPKPIEKKTRPSGMSSQEWIGILEKEIASFEKKAASLRLQAKRMRREADRLISIDYGSYRRNLFQAQKKEALADNYDRKAREMKEEKATLQQEGGLGEERKERSKQ